jgi:L-asparaginase II
MISSKYAPIYEFTRGQTVESIHFGAVVVVDITGRVVASYGDPSVVTFLRSTAKPFQVMPFLMHNGQAVYQLTDQEIALMCASHSGTDEHVTVIQSIQEKTGVYESDLLCGTHFPYDESTANALREQKLQPGSNRHNCSGKHTGMLAYARMLPASELPYIDLSHPLQVEILENFSVLCGLPVEEVQTGIDGCSAPNFAVPLYNAALAFARLCDPEDGDVGPENRITACKNVVRAMSTYPRMVAGHGRFDTRLMELGQGKLVSKAGAEGYQGMGLLPGALGPGSPALGIAIKVADGDARSKVRCAVAIEVLRQLGALDNLALSELSELGPSLSVTNWRKIEVGKGYPTFDLGLERKQQT